MCRILHQFVDFLSQEEVLKAHQLAERRVHLCYNFDPHTVDRDNPMAYDKRFHVHLNCWQRSQLDRVTPVAFGSIPDPVRRRDLLDPLAYLGPRVCFDMLTGTAAGLALMEPDPDRDLQMRLPVGLKVRLDDWQALGSPWLPELLRALHHGVVGVYAELRAAFTDGDATPVPWTRPSLLPAADIERRVKAMASLTEESKRLLVRLAEALRDVDDRTMAFFRRHRDLRSRCLALAGPAYSLGFYSPVVDDRDPCLLHQGPVYLVLQPKLFSRLGGAGLAYLDEFPAVRVRRGARRLSGAEEWARTQFQQDFLAHVRTDLAGEGDVSWDPSVPPRWQPGDRRAVRTGDRC